jgi:hypothetical protein
MRHLKNTCKFSSVLLLLAVLWALGPLVSEQTAWAGHYEPGIEVAYEGPVGDAYHLEDSDEGPGWWWSWGRYGVWSAEVNAGFYSGEGFAWSWCTTEAHTDAYSSGAASASSGNVYGTADAYARLTWTWVPDYPGDPASGLDCSYSYEGDGWIHADGRAYATDNSNAGCTTAAFGDGYVDGTDSYVHGDLGGGGNAYAHSASTGSAWSSLYPQLTGDSADDSWSGETGQFSADADYWIETHTDSAELSAGGTYFNVGTSVSATSAASSGASSVAGESAWAEGHYPAVSDQYTWIGDVTVAEK